VRQLASAIHIRPMTHHDLPKVMDIQRVAFTNPWSFDMVQKELTQEWSTVLLVEEDGPGGVEVRGFSIFWLVTDEMHLLNVAIDHAHRRRGLGRLVIEASLEKARAHKCRIATLEVRRSNDAAIALYGSLGFRAVGMRPAYYTDNREDAVVMIKDF